MSTLHSPIPTSTLLSALHWRYATKQFDAAKRIPTETWASLEEALVLTASSCGLQPWKFLVITNPEIREKLLPHSWNQKQITESSHLVVFALKAPYGETDVDHFLARQAEVQSRPVESLKAYREMIVGLINSRTTEQNLDWITSQIYIALGNFLTSAALVGVDTCPIEGFVPAEYDKVLDLPAKGLKSVVLAAAGYRADTDKYAHSPKVRFPVSEVIEHIA